MRKSAVTVLAALAVASAVPASAAGGGASVAVGYADLDLTAPAGAAALHRRIEAAVDKVCARPELRDLKGMTAWEECRAAALTDAMEQLSTLAPTDNPALASLV